MKFFCIAKETQNVTKDLIKKSVLDRGLEFIEIDVNKFNFYCDYFSKEEKEEKNLVYRIASGDQSRNIETQLLTENNGLATLYKESKRAFFSTRDISLQKFLQIPIIKTVNFIFSDYDFLSKSVEYLGGFPVVIKVSGRSHGEGIMKIDSMESLLTVVGFLKKIDTNNMVLREFIDSHRHARLVVLGGKVIDSIEYIVPENDFRTNAGEPIVKGEKFPDLFEKIAIDAVCGMEYDFGGVDILIDKENNPYLAEVNFPCYFPRNQLTTGVDISGMMVDFLINKANK